MLSNDPKDLILQKPTASAPSETSGQPTGQTIVVQNDDGTETVFRNPTGASAKDFNPLTFVLGSIVAFWIFMIMKFWYIIPAMTGFLFVISTPESLAYVTEAGITMGFMFKTIFLNMAWASGFSLIAPWVVGTRLRRGVVTPKEQMFMLQVPSLFFAGLAFFNVANLFFLMFKGMI